jgi:hypothetical protein
MRGCAQGAFRRLIEYAQHASVELLPRLDLSNGRARSAAAVRGGSGEISEMSAIGTFPTRGLRTESVGSLALSGHTRRVNQAIDAKTHANGGPRSIDIAMSPRRLGLSRLTSGPLPSSNISLRIFECRRMGHSYCCSAGSVGLAGQGNRLNLHWPSQQLPQISYVSELYAFARLMCCRARKTMRSPALRSADIVHRRNDTLRGSTRSADQKESSPIRCCFAWHVVHRGTA